MVFCRWRCGDLMVCDPWPEAHHRQNRGERGWGPLRYTIGVVAVVVVLVGVGLVLFSPQQELASPADPSEHPSSPDSSGQVGDGTLTVSGWQRLCENSLSVVSNTPSGAVAVRRSLDAPNGPNFEWLLLTPSAGGIQLVGLEARHAPVEMTGRWEGEMIHTLAVGGSQIRAVARFGIILHVSESTGAREFLLADRWKQSIWLVDPTNAAGPQMIVGPADWDQYPLPNPAEGLLRIWADAPAWSPDGG